jgi:hypothetical protein
MNILIDLTASCSVFLCYVCCYVFSRRRVGASYTRLSLSHLATVNWRPQRSTIRVRQVRSLLH